MENGVTSEEHMLEVIRFPLTSLRVDENSEYNQDLEGYLSHQELIEKIKTFNSTSFNLSISRMIIQLPLIFVLTTFVLIIVAVKSLGPFDYQEIIVIGLVFVTSFIAISLIYLFINMKGKHLIQEFNKEDNERNVNWKLSNVEDSRGRSIYFKLRPKIKTYLIIEIGLPPAYQIEGAHTIVIHDNEANTSNSTEDSPPYEEVSSLPNCYNSSISSAPPAYSEY